MDLKELKKSLKLNPRFINIFGKEDFFRKEATNLIISNFVSKQSLDFNVFSFIKDEPKKILAIISEVPFDSDFKVVFLSEKADNYVNVAPDFCVLVSLDSNIKKPNLSVNCSRVFGRRLKAIAKSYVKKYGINLDKQDISKFLELSSNSLYEIDNELFKLSLLDDVSDNTIKHLSSSNFKSKLNSFFISMLKNNISDCIKNYYILNSLGISDSQLFGFLVYSFKELFSSYFLEEKEDSFNIYIKYNKFVSVHKIIKCFKVLLDIEAIVKFNIFPLYIFFIAFFKDDFSLVYSYISRGSFSDITMRQ